MTIETPKYYNNAPQVIRNGLTRNDRPSLLQSINGRLPQSRTNETNDEEDEVAINRPPESSSDEELRYAGPEANCDDVQSSPIQTRPRFNRPAKVPRQYKATKRDISGAVKLDDAVEGWSTTQMKRIKKSYGKSSRIDTQVSKTNIIGGRDMESTNTNGFRVPGGLEALKKAAKSKASLSSSTAFKDPLSYGESKCRKKSPVQAFRTPLPAPSGPIFRDPPQTVSSTTELQDNVPREKDKRRKIIGRDSNATQELSKQVPKFAETIDSSLPEKLNAFRMPLASTTTTIMDSDKSPLSSPLSSPRSINSITYSSTGATSVLPFSPHSSESVCPLCGQSIPDNLLSDFADKNHLENAQRLTVNHQTVFCRHHRSLAARDRWTRKGYPEIEWSNLSNRVHAYEMHIASVIDNKVESYYRQRIRALDDLQRSKGGRRTLAQEFENNGDGGELLGYYGTKGARVIGDHIISSFKKKLKSLQKRDQDIIKCGGLGGFVQAILVPEVIERLVIDDSRVHNGERNPDVEAMEARKIMEESSDLGRLLCEEEEDVVDVESDYELE